MKQRGPWAGIAMLFVAIAVVLGGGTALGVGPLAATPPPSQVHDPDEMLARSLQATLDANAVHLEGTLSGSIPGGLVDRPEATVSLDGTVLEGDVRPHDAKTRTHLTSPGLELTLDTVTVWDSAYYRASADAPWSKASLGGASASAGVDINPLTLVDRLRSFLAHPGMNPVAVDVDCASPSGRCHRITLDAGSDPASILAALLPKDRTGALPPVRTTVILDTDTETLRPAHLVIDAVSADGSITLHLVIDASLWDQDVVIDEPVAAP